MPEPSAFGTPARENLEGNGPTPLAGYKPWPLHQMASGWLRRAATERSESGAWLTKSNCVVCGAMRARAWSWPFCRMAEPSRAVAARAPFVSGIRPHPTVPRLIPNCPFPSGLTHLPIWRPKTTRRESPPQGSCTGLASPLRPDGRSFITSDPDGSLGVWDTRSVQRTESLPALGSNNWGVALSPDGHWLAVGNDSGKVNVWDWRERRRVASFEVPFEYFGHLHFSRSGQFLWAIVMFNDLDDSASNSGGRRTGRRCRWRGLKLPISCRWISRRTTGSWPPATPSTAR